MRRAGFEKNQPRTTEMKPVKHSHLNILVAFWAEGKQECAELLEARLPTSDTWTEVPATKMTTYESILHASRTRAQRLIASIGLYSVFLEDRDAGNTCRETGRYAAACAAKLCMASQSPEQLAEDAVHIRRARN